MTDQAPIPIPLDRTGDGDAQLRALFALADSHPDPASLQDSEFTYQVMTAVRRGEALRLAIVQTVWTCVAAGLVLLAAHAWPQLTALAGRLSSDLVPAVALSSPWTMIAGGLCVVAATWWIAEKA